MSLIVAAYAEADGDRAKVANALRARLPARAAGGRSSPATARPTRTAERAREAGADLVLELPRGGKIRAQDAAVARARGEIVAFSDANALWEPDALRALVAPFADPRGRLRLRPGALRQRRRARTRRALYWRYEMALRALESRLASVTGGNGAIYATRREAYIDVDPVMGHDLSFPFNMVKRGWRARLRAGGARDARRWSRRSRASSRASGG